ncbi:putative BRCA1-associated [Dioscorea sansibarensis]
MGTRMADLCHLEKMGRELKCPICLCIMESMKSTSDCPICKVPFHRRGMSSSICIIRKVRPAPHMDNLVSIYKGMEAAAGVDICTTQIGPMVKKSDAQLPDNVEGNCDAAKTLIATHQKSKRCRLSKKKKKLNKADAGPNSSSSMMPSFPAKKRVHVTPYPPSETPIRPERVIKSANPSTQSEANQIFNKSNNQDHHKPGDPVFSPFFWLRERNEGVDYDDDDSDKHTTQQTAEVSPFNVLPCFSDIKDSDDEDQMKNTPLSKLDAPGLYDSEMFEWTQRACSPELCSTPLRDQVGFYLIDALSFFGFVLIA